DHPVRVIRLPAPPDVALEHELLLRVQCAQASEVRAISHLLWRPTVHGLEPRQRRVLPAPLGATDLAADLVARPQAELLDQLLRDVDVVGPGHVARFPAADETRPASHHL